MKLKNINLKSLLSHSLSGTAKIPGDKSISHRSLIIGSLSIGKSKVFGLLESDDVLATKQALIELGVKISKSEKDFWEIHGVGLHGFKSPTNFLNLQNSGTGARLLMGAVMGSNITTSFKGDPSLSSRPMMRIIEPLKLMGAKFDYSNNGTLPITMFSPKEVLSLDYKTPVSSAQIKSSILFSGLFACGCSIITEPYKSRDHTETMLKQFGANITSKTLKNGENCITLKGRPYLTGQEVRIPSDPSSAAFPLVAALITPGSKISLENVLVNPQRFGLIKTLLEMGAKLKLKNKRYLGNEIVATIEAEYSILKGIDVPKSRAPSMIDEYPILCVASAKAKGITTMSGISELRVKETDRIKLMVNGLRKAGIEVVEEHDCLKVKGGNVLGGCKISSELDHRIAMSFIILGLISERPIQITGCETISTSFPNFIIQMKNLGAKISESNQ